MATEKHWPWVSLLLDVVVIVFSVLLALLVNEWRETGRNRAIVERGYDGR